MKKEAPKIAERKVTLQDVMEKYGGVFSIDLEAGFAHIKFIGGRMYVTFLNDDGYVQEDGQDMPFDDMERVANFMREMKELRLEDFSVTKK